jgi:hypothetical protein
MKRDARQTWRTVGAALPAVALIGSGAALATTGGGATTAIAAESKPVVTVPAVPLTRPAAPVLPALPPIPEAEAQSLPAAYSAGAVPAATANGIPSRALEAYKRGAALVDAADPACGIDWALVAAIGKIESDHGRYAGNGLDESGTVRPGIFGMPLNGNNNTAVIRDTDGGAYDRDPLWDRAVGPMQFIPGTWRTVGVDADGDGAKNPQNMSDAATSTAVYLCSGPGDLTRAGDLRSAVLRYNQSDAYARQVIAIAEGYRQGVSVLPSAELSSDQRTASPYLPSGEQQASAKPSANTSAAAQKPRAQSTAAPAATSGPGSTGGSGSAGDAGDGGNGGGSTPSSSPTSTSGPGVVDTVTGVVKEATKPLTGATPSPSTSSSPAPSSTPSALEPVKPVANALGALVCPAGYEFRLSLDPSLCYPK